jgi:predicted Zn finger-like uncharacterized protein
MKITCQACQAKYTIADEKVLGKVVKIRCKKCGATIVVNGNDPSAVTTSSPPEAPSGGEAEAPEGWTVNVAEGDQRTMSDAELVAAYRAGTVDDETYCWKDGMDDWLPIREIAALYDACRGGAESKSPSVQPSGGRAAASANGSGANPAPVAARRAGGRAPSADLFGGAAQAGGEDDVMTSAPAKMPQQAHDDAKLIGARNENSVLFSLNTLTGKSDRPPPPPDSEASGLIDIRQLSAQLGGEETKKKGSRVDDIMNLSSGGAFSPTLTAPALAAPPIESYAAAAAEKASMAPGTKGRGMLVLAGLGGLLFVALAVGGAVTFMRGKGDETAEKERPAVSASAAGIAAPSEPTAVASASAAPDEAPASASAAPAASAPKEAPSAAPTAVAAAAPVQHAAPAAAAAPRPAPAAAAESDQPFNMGEAKARLAAVAGAVQSCKKAGGPTGTGRVVVVFAPSGAAQSASVTGDPFEGTPTGGCVANHFRAVRVPAFAGGAFSVAKSFTIN